MNLSLQIFLSLVLSVIIGLFLGEGSIEFVKLWVAPIGTMSVSYTHLTLPTICSV